MTPDAVTVLGHLADESRLRVFAAVLLGSPAETAEVARRAGLHERDVLRPLARLEGGGLVTRERDGWVAHPGLLREAVAAATPERHRVDHGAAHPDTAAVLRAFLPEGRLEQVPAARGKRLVVLDHIARVFEPGVRYPEREVNMLLNAFHADHAALRRYLVDEGFLARDRQVYWRSGGTVDV